MKTYSVEIEKVEQLIAKTLLAAVFQVGDQCIEVRDSPRVLHDDFAVQQRGTEAKLPDSVFD